MKKLRKMLAIIAAAIVAAFGVFSMPVTMAFAEGESTSSSVMDDLKMDSTFSVDSYPSMTVEEMKEAKQAELEVIKIAESANDELFIYVYQPTDGTKEIVATYLLIGQTESESAARVHPLKLVSTDGVFDKYLVEGFQVISSLSKRDYQITSIYRAFDKDLDADTGNDNKESNIAIGVAQTWHSRDTADGKIEYGYTKDDVITITDEWHGSIRYSDGWVFLGIEETDSHFIVFSTDFLIEDLRSAEVFFVRSEEVKDFCGKCSVGEDSRYKDGIIVESKEKNEVVKVEGKGGNAADHLGAHKYEWDNIATAERFLSENEGHLGESAVNNIEGIIKSAVDANSKAWVLRFATTSYSFEGLAGQWHASWADSPHVGPMSQFKYTKIKDVAILKLTFETKGIPYTMGVVDSMTTSDNIPDGEYTFWDGVLANIKDLGKDFQRSLRIIGLVLGAVVVVFAVFFVLKLIALLRDAFGKRGGGAGNDSGDGNAGNNAGGNANGG